MVQFTEFYSFGVVIVLCWLKNFFFVIWGTKYLINFAVTVTRKIRFCLCLPLDKICSGTSGYYLDHFRFFFKEWCSSAGFQIQPSPYGTLVTWRLRAAWRMSTWRTTPTWGGTVRRSCWPATAPSPPPSSGSTSPAGISFLPLDPLTVDTIAGFFVPTTPEAEEEEGLWTIFVRRETFCTNYLCNYAAADDVALQIYTAKTVRVACFFVYTLVFRWLNESWPALCAA